MCRHIYISRAAAVQTRGGRGPRSMVTRKGPRSAGCGHPQEGAVRGPQKTGEAQSAVRSWVYGCWHEFEYSSSGPWSPAGGRGPRSALTRRGRGPRSVNSEISAVRGLRSPAGKLVALADTWATTEEQKTNKHHRPMESL